MGHDADVSELPIGRRYFLGGTDARIIMGSDEAALVRLWQEKRGEVDPEDLSGNLIVQLGVATEELNRHWFELNTSQIVKDRQRRAVHPLIRWMAATSTVSSKQPGRCSKPSSCCRGPSRKKLRPRNTWPSCNTICGSSQPGARSFR